LGVLEGKDEALLNHNLIGSNGTPITYLNFEIKRGSIEEIERFLPENFELVKMKMRKGNGKERYMMTLRVSEGGIESSDYFGLKAELIVYIRCKSSPEEVYQMILEAKSDYVRVLADELTIAPVTAFIFEQRNENIETKIEDNDFFFSVTVPFKETGADIDSSSHALDLTWIASHDRHYYRNGIYDYYICDSRLYNMKAIYVGPADVDNMTVRSKWFDFVEQDPFEVLLARQDVGCIVRPWFNLNDATIAKEVWED